VDKTWMFSHIRDMTTTTFSFGATGRFARDDKPPQRSSLLASIGDAIKFSIERRRTHGGGIFGKKWETDEKPRPGRIYFVATTSGGYDNDSDGLAIRRASQRHILPKSAIPKPTTVS
jgi:hypothetical protein